jgi:two-component system LytT family response regulator
VVFVTAYGQYAARAFEMGVIDYLLKPFDSRRFGMALARVRKELRRVAGEPGRRAFPRTNGGMATSPVTLAAPPRPSLPARQLGRIMVKDGGRIHFIRVSDIDWIESADNYVRIHVGKEVHLMRNALKHFGACLDAGRFARIHRCTIVNLDRVREIQPGVGRDHIVILEDGTRLKLSPRYRRHLEQQAEPGR